MELLEVLGLDVKRPHCLVKRLGVIFEVLEAFLVCPGVPLRPFWILLGRSWRPLGASWSALRGVLGPLRRLLGRLGGDLGAS